MDKVYHVTRAIVRNKEIVLLHDAHKSVMVLTPDDKGKFRMSEPDGEERLDWLLRLGAITNDEAEAEAAKLPTARKRKLIERIQAQMEAK